MRCEYFVTFVLVTRPWIGTVFCFENAFANQTGVASAMSIDGIINIVLVGILMLNNWNKKREYHFLLKKYWLIMIFFSVLSLWHSPNMMFSLRKIIRLFSDYLLALYIFHRIKDVNKLKYYLKVILVSAIIPVFWGIYNIFTGDYGNFITFFVKGIIKRPDGVRIAGPFNHANSYGYFLCIIILFSLNYFLSHKAFLKKTFWLFFSSILFILLGFTFSRGAWLACLVGILCLRNNKIYKFIIAGMSVLLIGYTPIIQDVFTHIKNLDITSPIAQSTLHARLYIWHSYLKIIPRYIFIGNGLGTSTYISNEIMGQNIATHNDYLLIFVELGGVALIAYLSIIYLSLKKALYLGKRIGDPFLKNILHTLFAIIMCISIASMADGIFINQALVSYFWIIIAFVFAIQKIYIKEVT
ncbi:MAG: O-antigen ligase family protein [bacterium]